jgi:TolA-binding protein
VVRDDKAEVYTVRYDAVKAMLHNEFLKEQRKVEKLEATVGQQQQSFESKFAELEKKIEALTSGLQKVSAQLEMSKPAPKTVLNQ